MMEIAKEPAYSAIFTRKFSHNQRASKPSYWCAIYDMLEMAKWLVIW